MWFTRLIDWWRGPAPEQAAHLQFIVYSRQNCHLCTVALEQLRVAQRRHGFSVEVVDVDGDPDLKARHGDWVPVVTLNSKVRFRGAIHPVLLRRLLRAEARRSVPRP